MNNNDPKYNCPGGSTREHLDRMQNDLRRLESEGKKETREYKALEEKYQDTRKGYEGMSCI